MNWPEAIGCASTVWAAFTFFLFLSGIPEDLIRAWRAPVALECDCDELEGADDEIERLQSRIAELEAQPCPYLNAGGVTRYCTLNGAPNARVTDLLELLCDVWNQFSVERADGSRWHGGLSVLEDVEIALDDAEIAR